MIAEPQGGDAQIDLPRHRCPACLTLIPDAAQACPHCTLRRGDAVGDLDALVPYAVAGASHTAVVPSCRTWATRLGLASGESHRGWEFTPLAAEMLAQRRGWRVERLRTSAPGSSRLLWSWRHGAMINLRLRSPAPQVPAPGALGLAAICRPTDARPMASLVDACRPFVSAIAIVMDSEGNDAITMMREAIVERCGDLQMPLAIVARPLDGDFAAQRNHAQSLLATRWTLALDTDERPTPQIMQALGWLIADCDEKGRVVCGLARRNYVDGTLTECYPDYSYRLLRTRVPWVGRVHEVPEPCRRFDATTWAWPVAALDHQLDGARLAIRRRTYEALQSGAGGTFAQRLLEVPRRSPSF